MRVERSLLAEVVANKVEGYLFFSTKDARTLPEHRDVIIHPGCQRTLRLAFSPELDKYWNSSLSKRVSLRSQLAQIQLDLAHDEENPDWEQIELVNYNSAPIIIPTSYELPVGIQYVFTSPMQNYQLENTAAKIITESRQHPAVIKKGTYSELLFDAIKIPVSKKHVRTRYHNGRIDLSQLPRGTQRDKLHVEGGIHSQGVALEDVVTEVEEPILLSSADTLILPKDTALIIAGGVKLNRDGNNYEWVTHSQSDLLRSQTLDTKALYKHPIFFETYYQRPDFILCYAFHAIAI